MQQARIKSFDHASSIMVVWRPFKRQTNATCSCTGAKVKVRVFELGLLLPRLNRAALSVTTAPLNAVCANASLYKRILSFTFFSEHYSATCAASYKDKNRRQLIEFQFTVTISSDHVSDALISLHWLRVPERIRSKVALLVYTVHHGCAPSYFGPFNYVADLPSRRGLRSSCSDCLVQPPVHHSTVGNRAFSVAGLRCGTACQLTLRQRHL